MLRVVLCAAGTAPNSEVETRMRQCRVVLLLKASCDSDDNGGSTAGNPSGMGRLLGLGIGLYRGYHKVRGVGSLKSEKTSVGPGTVPCLQNCSGRSLHDIAQAGCRG